MSSPNTSIFRTLLLAESAANIGSIIPALFAPELALSYLVRGPSQITPATKSLMQLFGGFVVLATAPLLLSYLEERQSVEQVIAKRRLTYAVMGISELAIGSITLAQYMQGNSGLTDQALLMATGAMAVFTAMRGYFLFVRPELIMPSSGKGSGKKLQ